MTNSGNGKKSPEIDHNIFGIFHGMNVTLIINKRRIDKSINGTDSTG